MPNHHRLRLAEASAILLFWLQGLIVALSRLFGVAYDAVFAATLGPLELGLTIAGVAASFLGPVLLPARRERMTLLASSVVAAFARIALVFGHPGVRLWTALILIAAGTIYALTLMRRRPSIFATAFVTSLVVAQLLRVAGNTYDISLRSRWLPVQVVMSFAACAAAWRIAKESPEEVSSGGDRGIGVLRGLAFGALLFLETSLLGFPNALARWTEAEYYLVAPLLIAATILPLLRAAQWGGFALFVATLVAGWMTGHQFYQLAILAPMLLAQLAFISSLWNRVEPVEGGRTRFSFGVGLGLFLVLNVALAFAFTYPYTLTVMRGKADYVFLLSVVMLLLPALGQGASSAPELPRGRARALVWGAAASAVLLTTLLSMPPAPAPHTGARDSFRAATYNIHYGYDSDWRYTLDDQARTIEQSGADIVLLQEVDAGRITSYGVDDALWLGRRLGMEHVFGPALEDLSGVALLSRFPITESDTQHLTSELEQTAMVHARVEPPVTAPSDSEVFEEAFVLDVFGTWLGLEASERARQLDDALNLIGAASPAILGGDFNAPPGSPTYPALQEAGFEDVFSAAGLDGPPTSPAIDPRMRIDFVWSRGLDVTDAQVLDSLASDHRLVVGEFDLP